MALFMLAGLLGLATAGCTGPTRGERFVTYQAEMRARGFLRTEAAPIDVPFSNRDLAEHFRRIAFFEYPNDEEHVAKPLTRWAGPLNYAIFGAPADRPVVARFMAHLATLTRLEITAVPEGDANFLILALDERQQIAATRSFDDKQTRARFAEFLSAIFDCGAIAVWSDEAPEISQAMVYLHGDLRGLYRKLCFHEEIAQSLGLFNDDPTVRPSIFNDDDEFALLTTHDEYLLRILYDARLKPGMTSAEAMPVVARIIEELRPGK